MPDPVHTSAPGANAPEFTVSEISGAVRRTVEGAFGRIRVRGEVGRVFRARSGHLYYDLKDDRNVLACTTWKGQAAHLSVMPEEGLEVIVTGRLTTFGAQSKYNLNVDEVTIAGEGALMAMLERRRKALAAEGLFSPEHKQPIPFLPQVIGVVTSPSGAVIRDILHRLRDRFPRRVLIWPVAVQGDRCAPEVARAIAGFNALSPGGPLPRPDLLIVARGGGSVEDLWGFNEEIVVRAAAASGIPLISAVGHETDTTLIDHVADVRAPTPTAAAELAVPVRMELLARTGEQEARLIRAVEQAIARRGQRLRDMSRALPRPRALVAEAGQRLDRWGERLPGALIRLVQGRQVSLSRVAAGLRPGMPGRRVARGRAEAGALAARFEPALRRGVRQKRRECAQVAERLRLRVVQRELEQKDGALRALLARLSGAARTQTEAWAGKLDGLDRVRRTLGYTATLKRGYAVVRGKEAVVTSRAQAVRENVLEIEFHDGRLRTGPGGAPRGGKAGRDRPEQGRLF